MSNTIIQGSTSTTKEIKWAIGAIVRNACFPNPSLKDESDYHASLEFLNTLQPEPARAAIALADMQIADYFKTSDED
jgi:hypothetical protein